MMLLEFLTPDGLLARYRLGRQGELVTLEAGPVGQQDLDVMALLRYLDRAQAITLGTAIVETARQP